MKILKIDNTRCLNNKAISSRETLPFGRSQRKNKHLNYPSLQINQPAFLGNIVNNEPSKDFGSFNTYENELDFVRFKLINPLTKTNNKQGNSNLPNGVILFGPTGGGKTYFADVIMEELAKNGIKIVKPKVNFSQEKRFDKIRNSFKDAEQRYYQTGKYTAVKIPVDIAAISSEDFDKYLNNSAKNGVVWIGETTNVQRLKTSHIMPESNTLKIPLYTIDEDHCEKYLEQVLKNTQIKRDFNYRKVIDYLNSASISLTPANYKFWSEEIISQANNDGEIVSEQGFANSLAEKYYSNPQYEHRRKEFEADKEYVYSVDSNNTYLKSVKISSSSKEKIRQAMSDIPDVKTRKDDSLKGYEQANSRMISTLSNDGKIDVKSLQGAVLGNDNIVDLWIKLDEESADISDYTPYLKSLKIGEILEDRDKTTKFVRLTLERYEKENSLIALARKSYTDVIENEDTLSSEEKEILTNHQDSRLFFLVISNNLNSNEIAKMQKNIVMTVRQLAKEKNSVKQKTFENIFAPAYEVSILSSQSNEDNERISFIFGVLNKKIEDSNSEERQRILNQINSLENSRLEGNEKEFEAIWTSLVKTAQSYFETTMLNDLTDRNIELVNSINTKKANIEDKTILKLLENRSLTIEQKDFVARYAQNDSFKAMVKNQNIDINGIIEDLLLFEASNQQLIYDTNIEFSEEIFDSMMSNKFREVNQKAKDIYIQTNRIVSKLDDINSSINSQSEIISAFANNFSNYANSSLVLQAAQLKQLIEANKLLFSINANTKEISSHARVITGTKLLELEKNEYYRDIVPQLVQLLPKDEQVDIEDFLSKVDNLAKKEKNSIRKKKIIKAAIIIAGAVAAGVAAYYFGTAVISHLFSQVTNPTIATSAISSVTANTNLARKMGNCGLLFGNSVGWPQDWYSIKEQLKSSTSRDANRAISAIESAKGHGGISMNEIKQILNDFGFKISGAKVIRK